VDREVEEAQTIIMLDFHTRNLKIITFLIFKEEENDMTIITQPFTSQCWWTNQKLNALSVTSMTLQI
jgi:hypothetical protein